MKHHAVEPPLRGLHRNPVLTAMMVTFLVLGVTASLAGIASWRASSACALAPTPAGPNDAPVVTGVAQPRDLLMHQAEHADLEMRTEQPLQSDPALSREVTSGACPCAVSTEWHWRI